MRRETDVSIPVSGMDCADCARAVERELRSVDGVSEVGVSFTSERALVRYDAALVDRERLVEAIERAGYGVANDGSAPDSDHADSGIGRTLLRLFGLVIGVILFIVVLGEWLGLFDQLSARVPWPLWLAGIVAGGYPVFRNVARATLRGRIIAHSLMTVGALAAIAVGEWPTAAVVVFFMRIGEYVEGFTASKARRALRDLTEMLPRMARVERDEVEREIDLADVEVGDVVVVRPGERIPVDGEVMHGRASVDQASITGESMPIDVEPGDRVYAATIPLLGSLRVRAGAIGPDSTFGRVIAMVEESESQRADVQRLADRFATYYLPVVVAIAALTLVVRQDVLAMTAVLVVACSCSFALATPIAILASVGSAARRGVLVKGGRYLESLAATDVVLIDKTGTLTLGRPRVARAHAFRGFTTADVALLAAAVERDSEHPLARAIRDYAWILEPETGRSGEFEALPGLGVRAVVDGRVVEVGNARLLPAFADMAEVTAIERDGMTAVGVSVDGEPAGVFGIADELRPDAAGAIARLRDLGFERIEILTGDNERVASAIAARLGTGFRANLLPEDKIAIVRELQREGLCVVMVGDGVNDAPALAQADVGIALGVAGTDIAKEAAPVSLMRDEWNAVPMLFLVARRTMRVIRLNIGFTAAYNLVGLSLAALGFLPPALAAAAQSIPDIGILANSSRLLRSTDGEPGAEQAPAASRPPEAGFEIPHTHSG
jgi:P-type Cu+ transporter